MNKFEQEIVSTFEKLKLDPAELLVCESAGDLVDNGYGAYFEKPKYAMISNKYWATCISDYQFQQIIEFEDKHDISILKLYSEAVNRDKLLSDGYFPIWNKKVS